MQILLLSFFSVGCVQNARAAISYHTVIIQRSTNDVKVLITTLVFLSSSPHLLTQRRAARDMKFKNIWPWLALYPHYSVRMYELLTACARSCWLARCPLLVFSNGSINCCLCHLLMFYRKNICIKVIETAVHKPGGYLQNKLYGVGQISELGCDVWIYVA